MQVKNVDLNGIRLKEHLGIVTSESDTKRFSFFVNPLRNRISIGKGDYIILDHPVLGDTCPLLALVTDVKNYEEIVGATISDRSIKTIAVGETIGYVDLKSDYRPIRRLFIPPNPGSKIYLPYREFLEDIFSRNPDGIPFEHPLHIGNLESYATSSGRSDVEPLNFYLNSEDFSKQHFLITSISGVGKTQLATVIVEELANKTDYPVVILDPYGEYNTIGIPGGHFKDSVERGNLFTKDYSFDFGISMFAPEPEKLRDKLDELGTSPARQLLSTKPISSNWMQGVNDRSCLEIRDELKQDIKPKHVTLINSEGLSLDERNNLYKCCIRALWSGRVKGQLVPFVLIAEGTERLEAATLSEIASEGRKAKVSLLLITQHPSGMDRRILSQMGIQIMGRTVDAEDLECLKVMAGEEFSLLPHLKIGEWILNGVTLGRPTKVMARRRFSLGMK